MAYSSRSFGSAMILALCLLSVSPVHASSSKAKADQEAGALLFRDQGCAHCHGAGGVGGKKGPDLSGLPKDKTWTVQKITDQILNGGQKMPPFSDALTDQQIAQLVAYLRSKHRPIPLPADATAPAPAAQ